MAIGAIEAMKAAGLKPGDIKIVSVDGTRGGFQAMIDGWIQADVECNPLLGPQVYRDGPQADERRDRSSAKS